MAHWLSEPPGAALLPRVLSDALATVSCYHWPCSCLNVLSDARSVVMNLPRVSVFRSAMRERMT